VYSRASGTFPTWSGGNGTGNDRPRVPVLIAGPNLTLDRILRIDELRPGEVLRFSEATIAPGGKGVNVIRVAKALGFPATLVALAPGRTGRAVIDLLGDEGLAVDAVATGGEARAASIVLESSGRVTVLNEPGPTIREEDWVVYERSVSEHLPGEGFLVCIGSTPPGSPPDAYARLVGLARERGMGALVDAAGDSLADALAAGPELVTPSLAEAEEILHGAGSQPSAERSADVRDRALAAASTLVGRGAGIAMVTAAQGLAVDRGSERWWVDAPPVTVRNPIGAGDTLVGGVIGSLERGHDLRSALRLGVAAASASVETNRPGFLDPQRVQGLVGEVTIVER
jgi:1-phosphofructokinase family hexose kinase